VYFKQQEYGDCLSKINKVLAEETNNIKALVRRGQAHMMLGDNDLATKDFKRALELDPNNTDVKKLMIVNKKRVKQQKEKERKIFGDIFASKSKNKTKEETATKSQIMECKEGEKVPVEHTEK